MEQTQTLQPLVRSGQRQRKAPGRSVWCGGLHLRRDVRTYASQVLNQQMWCFGYDIRRPAGNLLIEYGFEKHLPPLSLGVSSSYSLTLSNKRAIRLWGFGMFHGEPPAGGLFLGRFSIEPCLTACCDIPDDIWEAAAIPDITTPTDPGEIASTRLLLTQTMS
ncbi:MAG: hypothetical protein M3439_02195, partial [Chloroflexota bacterium]|nr:hypothetical protein [Chloroflexota bacterium]